MKTKFLFHEIPVIRKIAAAMCGLLALTAPLTTVAQQTVFSDTFGSSTLNQTNAFPGGTPTASSTSYTCASPKVAPNFSIAPGHLHIYCPSTSSANSEAQAMFTKFPVTLASVGDYIEVTYTFTDYTNQMNNVGGNGSGFHMGLFNSGGTPPLGGTILQNGGLGGATTAYVGGVSNWVGYVAQMLFNQTAGTAWILSTRPVQTIAQNIDQELMINDNNPKGTTLAGGSITPPGPYPFPLLTMFSQYTGQLRITLSAPGTLTVSNGLYSGVGTGGTLLYSNVATASGATLLTTNFDGLAFGFRATGGGVAWTNDINSITVVAGLAAQAGPYFTLTSTGTGCGSSPIGLNGSVTTNVYLLYTNGVYTGLSQAGTGAPLSFGTQTKAGVYTIIASNIVTTSVGPMYGSQTISVSAPTIAFQPSNASVVTNAPTSFGVIAIGNTLTYQWYKNGIALTNGSVYTGVTTSNLLVTAATSATAATTATGYYVVGSDPCGDSVTSSPNASLTLLAPNNLVWQGNNPNDNWDVNTTLNFTNPVGAAQVFIYGDNVTFNDSSSQTTVTESTNLTPSLVTVSGTQSYTFEGSGNITGFSQLVDTNSGVLTILSTNTYTGGTLICSNATLNLGNTASGSDGFVAGIVTINTNGVLNYNYFNNETIANALAGNGTVNYSSAQGGTLTLPIPAVNNNFTGVQNLIAGVRVHAQTGSSFPFGNGSTINVPAFSQAYCDTATYNNIFNIAGIGWNNPATPGVPPTGAISVFGSIFTGAINLTDNARISGTISGGTILCPITGPFQLEIWGNTNSYLLSIGPTNGVSNYASTLITSGSVRALNTNAISTGPLLMDLQGDLRLNSFNLSVSNLTSVNIAGLAAQMSTIQNTGTTNAVLTVGADGTSTEFDGTFINGGTGSVGLTKVGSGVLTLTGISSNTGPVTVSGGTLAMSGAGSFGSASVIAPASGAIYDVTATGNPLTLNNGQTLKGSGTVNGSVVASAGSTINPGDSIGKLTVNGNLSLAGTMLMELNRASSPATNDSIAVTGTLTAGGTLTVTNLGPALHVGDTFQLFSGGVSGFTSVNLETNDAANNVAYTWNNTIGSNGKIAVATVATLVNTNAPRIQVSVSGTTLTLGWPTNAGWTLLTNSVGLAATNQWFPYPNSANLTNATIIMKPNQTNVFFEMKYPYP